MNTTTDFTKLSAENAGVLVSALSTDIRGQFGASGAVATVISLPEKEGALRPMRIVHAQGQKSRGIPELDSPMAG